ncbi:hypothetical protein EJ110_NYTH49887 [Nymphaea thermarum]|nr:hypothetical protein EJ110_NYTH49887 [Nymphaea thermarum]
MPPKPLKQRFLLLLLASSYLRSSGDVLERKVELHSSLKPQPKLGVFLVKGKSFSLGWASILLKDMINTRSRAPFTASQWQELEHQALIFKYMVAGVPVPPELLLPIRRSSDSFSPSLLHQNNCNGGVA